MTTDLLLDLDGTLIVDQGSNGRDPDTVQLLPGVPEGLQRLQKAGIRFLVVTNQAGINADAYTEDDFFACFDRTCALLDDGGVQISAFRYCPHTPEENCECRKPKIDMWMSLKEEFPEIDPATTVMVGDKDRDVEFGKNIGCKTARVRSTAYPMTAEADYTVNDLTELADILLQTS
jgi:D-glycero-D-manno-heptose 1,7-bisphosphate phosphatase